MKTHLLGTFAILAAITRVCAQGDLIPPGPPAPMMKSLDQLEPRTIVNATNTPGDATTTFIISAPGSYYLTGNVTGVAGQAGIRITASDVTLDLGGFVLLGVAGSSEGIVTDSVRNIAVRNGTVRDWGFAGIEAGLSANGTFERIRASNNGVGSPGVGAAISTGFGSIVRDCAAYANSNDGFMGNGTGAISGCAALNNAGSGFVDAFPGGSAFTQCAASGNTNDGFSSAGGSTFTDCTARANTSYGFSSGSNATLTGCTASTNSTGIFAVDKCTISNCTSTSNRDDGIAAFGACLILNNNASVNGTDGSGDGIRTINPGNRIDGNHAASNAFRGIRCLGGAPFDDIIRNTAPTNGVGGYAPSSTTRMGPLSTPSTATSPWANF